MSTLTTGEARAIACTVNALVSAEARAAVRGTTDNPCHDKFVLLDGGLRIYANIVRDGSIAKLPVPMFIDITTGVTPGTYDISTVQPYVLFAAPHSKANGIPAEKLSEAVTALGANNTGGS